MGVTAKQKQGKGPFYLFICHRGARKTKRAGDQEAAEAAAEKTRALLEGDNQTTPGFEAYSEQWLEQYAGVACKRSTADNYRSI